MNPEERMKGKRAFLRVIYENPKVRDLMASVVNCHAKTCYLCTLPTVINCFNKFRYYAIRDAWQRHHDELLAMRNEMVATGMLEYVKEGHPTGGKPPIPIEEQIDMAVEKAVKKIEKVKKAQEKGDINLLKEAVEGGKEKGE